MSEQSATTELKDYPHKMTASLVHERAARYTKQLISHWRGGAERIETTDSTTTMFFAPEDPDKVSALRFENQSDRVVMTIGTISSDHGTLLAEVIDEHLHRFAGKRDVLEINWNLPT